MRSVLGKCWTNVERRVQTTSTPFSIFENKGNVLWMLNESLNRFKIDSTRFQHFFTLSTMLNDLFKRPQHLVQRSVGRMLTYQLLKPFKRALVFHKVRVVSSDFRKTKTKVISLTNHHRREERLKPLQRLLVQLHFSEKGESSIKQLYLSFSVEQSCSKVSL